MEVLIIKDSVIKNGEIIPCGNTIELDEENAHRLIKMGIVEAVDKVHDEALAEEAESLTGYLDAEQLEDMKVEDLRKLAKDMGLDSTGKKAELIERITAEEVQVDVEDDEMPNTGMDI